MTYITFQPEIRQSWNKKSLKFKIFSIKWLSRSVQGGARFNNILTRRFMPSDWKRLSQA